MLDLIHNLFGYMGMARVYSISHDFTGRVFHWGPSIEEALTLQLVRAVNHIMRNFIAINLARVVNQTTPWTNIDLYNINNDTVVHITFGYAPKRVLSNPHSSSPTSILSSPSSSPTRPCPSTVAFSMVTIGYPPIRPPPFSSRPASEKAYDPRLE